MALGLVFGSRFSSVGYQQFLFLIFSEHITPAVLMFSFPMAFPQFLIAYIAVLMITILLLAATLVQVVLTGEFLETVVLQFWAAADVHSGSFSQQLLLQICQLRFQSTELLLVLLFLGKQQLFVMISLLSQFGDLIGVAVQDMSDLAAVVLGALQLVEHVFYVFFELTHKTDCYFCACVLCRQYFPA